MKYSNQIIKTACGKYLRPVDFLVPPLAALLPRPIRKTIFWQNIESGVLMRMSLGQRSEMVVLARC